MALKVYKSVTGRSYNFPVTVSSVTTRIDISPSYSTTDTGIQAAIEAKSYFTSGEIATIGNYTTQVKALLTSDVVSGKILTSEVNAAGTVYVADDVIELSSATGKKAIIRVLTVTGGLVTTYEVTDPGTKYTANDILTQVKTTSTAGTGFQLKVLTTTGATEFTEVGPFKLTSFPDVTTINQAKDILRAEPYNVNHQKLRTPEAIMAQAIEHSVTFPNWVI